ncbi:MAG: response regulator [Spirochaetes bacterium]|nr:response regulator [Spirochaetota bacterium]
MNFKNFTFDIYKNAINIYLENAYPNGIKEKSFCYNNINKFKNAKSLSDILSILEESIISYDNSIKKKKYSIQLGSEKYPFLKLVLLEANDQNDYGFLIDRHTEYLALLDLSSSYEEEKKIKDYSRKLKYKIEEEFEKNNIPTYREIIKKETEKLLQIYTNKKIESNKIRVLIVDDDKDNLNLLKLNLELLGYTVNTASNGEEAVNIVHHDINNIMILDLMMPEMNGFDVIKSISKKIPILVLTALTDETSKNNCIKYGAKDVLSKPVEINIIDKILKKILMK